MHAALRAFHGEGQRFPEIKVLSLFFCKLGIIRSDMAPRGVSFIIIVIVSPRSPGLLMQHASQI